MTTTEHAQELHVPKGTVIFRQGDPGNEMFIIESGSVDLLRHARGAEPIATLEAGDCFGEMALLEEQPRFTTAVARTNVRLLRIEKRSIAVSARSGQGIEELLALIDDELPRPSVEIEALVPYTHGKLVARAHTEGEVISEEHTPEGTLLKVRVHEELAAELTPYVPTPAG